MSHEDRKEQDRVPVMVRMPAELHDQLRRRAEREGRSLGSQAAMLIRQALERAAV